MWRWGWRMFLAPAQSSSCWRDRQSAVPRPLQQPQGPARVLGRFGKSQRNQFGFSPSKSVQPPVSPVARGLNSLEASSTSCSPDPASHRRAGLQRLDNPVVTRAFTGFRHIGLQQYPRLQQPLRCACLCVSALRVAYVPRPLSLQHTSSSPNSFGAMIALRRIECDQSESQNSCSLQID